MFRKPRGLGCVTNFNTFAMPLQLHWFSNYSHFLLFSKQWFCFNVVSRFSETDFHTIETHNKDCPFTPRFVPPHLWHDVIANANFYTGVCKIVLVKRGNKHFVILLLLLLDIVVLEHLECKKNIVMKPTIFYVSYQKMTCIC